MEPLVSGALGDSRARFGGHAVRAVAIPLAIGLITLVAFAPALQNGFTNWDDDRNFTDNLRYRGLGWAPLRWMWTTTLMGHWIPLTWMTLGLNYVLGGMEPWGYHFGNMLIHAVNAVLLYYVGRRLLGVAGVGPGRPRRWGSATAALVFGIHPLRVESVAWVTERRDVLCGLFFLLAVLAYLRSTEAGPSRGRARVASLAAFAAALLSKAQAVPLPVALLILDVYPLRRLRTVGWRSLLLEKAPYFALSAAAGTVALLAVKTGSQFTDYEQYGAGARLAMTTYGLMFYPWKWLWPVGLSPLYELPARVDPLSARFIVPSIALVVATVILVTLRRRWPGGLAAWIYSAVMLLPVVGPVHAGHELAHDRYSYLSGIGFAVVAGSAIVWVLRAGETRLLSPLVVKVFTAGALFGLLGLGTGTWIQTTGWRDSETLWRWAVDVDPRCVICHNNLGGLLGQRGDLPEAITHFERALALRPDSGGLHANLGLALLNTGRSREALRHLRIALDRNPRDLEARTHLARALLEEGQPQQAIEEAEAVLRGRPDHAGPLTTLGRALTAAGRAPEAIPLLRRAAALKPGAADVHLGLARAYLAVGDETAAREETQTLRRLQPHLAEQLEGEFGRRRDVPP